jgi:hypothetical protein
MQRTIANIGITKSGAVTRRRFFQVSLGGLAAGGAAALGWRELLLAQAQQLRQRGKSLILLWMDGGPSQFETFNPKPGSENQGPCGVINTNVPGVQFAEFWPRTARVMDKIALIRSMQSREAQHDRAITLVRTGYPPSVAVRYPTFGSVVAMKREDPDFELPAFVRIGQPRIATRDVDHGVLGVRYASFNIHEPGRLPPDVQPIVANDVLDRRLELAQQFNAEFARAGGQAAVAEQTEVYNRTSQFVQSPRLNVFDLSREPQALRDAYGQTSFGQGCLLARRLVEQGVSFIEVMSTGGRNDAGWDTHTRGFVDQPNLCAEVDPAYSTLLIDLESRGLLENTLVLWIGEFGRTPRIKADGGRDHYAQGWLAGLSGGGVRAGQVIGATDRDGVRVTDRPISVQDLFFSLCQVLDINPADEYHTFDNRPIAICENGEVIRGLF